MRHLTLWTALAAAATGAAIPYFTHVRSVSIAAPDRQSYVVVDPEIWTHARRDLSDLRLYEEDRQVPYALVVKGGGNASQESEARLFDLGRSGAETQFTLDIGSMTRDYDRVQLRLKTKNFVARATVEGRHDASEPWLRIAENTLYDFSREKLGDNKLLRLPASTFRYLRVRIAGKVPPADIETAYVILAEQAPTRWTSFVITPQVRQEPRRTIITWEQPEQVPLERVEIRVPAEQVNFRREVKLQSGDSTFAAAVTGSISRIHLTRGGATIAEEYLALSVAAEHAKRYTLTIENGDDPPLAISSIQPMYVERRVYFDPRGRTRLNLYYGDAKLGPPVYDYAKFFREDAGAQRAELGPGGVNSAYTGRPDDRPWSERHQIVLWAALAVVVFVLAAVALRGLASGTQPSRQG